MRALFADDLVFEGPFHRSTTAEEYLDSLMEDPPREVSYVLEKTYQDDDSVCQVYIFSRPGVTTRMAQIFEIADGKICRIRLVFDSNAFK